MKQMQWLQKFKESGYEIVDMNDDISDICIVNTCLSNKQCLIENQDIH